MKSRRLKARLVRIPILILFIALAAVMLIPIIWLLFGAFKPDTEIISYPPTFFPHEFTLSNFTKCMQRIDIIQYIKNSIIFSVGATLPSLVVNSLAGYAFARYEFKGKDVIFVIFLATMMIPFQVIMIPEFLEIHMFGMYDTYAGLIIPKIASAYWIFMMRSAFAGLPKELEEAALLDGCNRFQIFGRIMLPLTKAGIVSLVIFTAKFAWNDFMWPLIVNTSMDKMTLGPALSTLQGQYTTKYPMQMAGAVMAVIPIIVLFFIFQKQFIEGVAQSGIKG